MKTVDEERTELIIKSLREQLAKERGLRKELVEALSEWIEVARRKYPPKDLTGIALLKHYEDLIKRAV